MARRATRQADKPVIPVSRPTAAIVRAKAAKATPAKAAATPQPSKSIPTKLLSKALAKGTAGTTKPDLDGLSADQKVAVLLRDREKLVTRLQAAEARINEMEAREEHLTDRISWALDTLGDLLRLPDAS